MVRRLAELPQGVKVFIDTNIFHLYLRGPRLVRESCTAFLERVESGEIEGYTSTLVLDELAYKLLLKRIEEQYRQNPLKIIRERRNVIAEAVPYVEEGLNIVLGIEKLRVIGIERTHLEEFTEYMSDYLLLPRDALHVALMKTIDCENIASADKDFDVVPGIIRWSPL